MWRKQETDSVAIIQAARCELLSVYPSPVYRKTCVSYLIGLLSVDSVRVV